MSHYIVDPKLLEELRQVRLLMCSEWLRDFARKKIESTCMAPIWSRTQNGLASKRLGIVSAAEVLSYAINNNYIKLFPSTRVKSHLILPADMADDLIYGVVDYTNSIQIKTGRTKKVKTANQAENNATKHVKEGEDYDIME